LETLHVSEICGDSDLYYYYYYYSLALEFEAQNPMMMMVMQQNPMVMQQRFLRRHARPVAQQLGDDGDDGDAVTTFIHIPPDVRAAPRGDDGDATGELQRLRAPGARSHARRNHGRLAR
jgi:hypothetical protein